MKKINALFLFIITVCIGAFSFFSYGGITEDVAKAQEDDLKPLDIQDLSAAYDAILNKSTSAFIGGHPVDEGFLSFITGVYGSSLIEEIASNACFDSPEIWYQYTGKSIHVLWYDYCQATGMESFSFDNTYVYDFNDPADIVLDFSGDFSVADNIATTIYMEENTDGIRDCFSSDLLEKMQSADIFMLNNEFAYTSRGTPLKGKAYTFRSNPDRVSMLNELGVDIVSLANNHVYDYDEVGLLDTLDTLDDVAMPYVGAGHDLSEAMKPVYYIVAGRKIAIVAATQIERSYTYTKAATEYSAGVLKCLDPTLFCQVISEAKAKADYVIAICHWGTEGNIHYGDDQLKLAESFVEAGADAIIGGHTHCLQTVEYIEDVPVFYSLGNYFFATTSNMPQAYDTGLAEIRIAVDGSLQAYFYPCRFDSGVTSLLSDKDKDKERITSQLNSLSQTAIIKSDGHILKKK